MIDSNSEFELPYIDYKFEIFTLDTIIILMKFDCYNHLSLIIDFFIIFSVTTSNYS